jgi:putative hydrolase
MEPVEALERIARLLERKRAGRYREEAFRRAADAVRDLRRDELAALARGPGLERLPGVGGTTARVITEALAGGVPEYLARLEAESSPDIGPGAAIRQALRGDLHLHSNWSDGGATIEQMARRAQEIGHDYVALTDHSPSLGIAHGLSVDRLLEQLDVLAQLNHELAPFRVLAGLEVDILEDGALDMEDDVLARLDVVVASVHSKLRMPSPVMTDRLVAAIANPHSDVVGHCTGRLVLGKGRAESTFDAEVVLAGCARFDKAIEINCRPERLDPPMRILQRVAKTGCKVAINSDAHAVGQLEWQPYGCARAAEAGLDPERIVNAWPAEQLLAWTHSHVAG